MLTGLAYYEYAVHGVPQEDFSMRVLIGLALVLVLGVPAVAGAVEKKMQLVGFTTAVFDGDEGVIGFTMAC